MRMGLILRCDGALQGTRDGSPTNSSEAKPPPWNRASTASPGPMWPTFAAKASAPSAGA
jgi:hypothetical protein